MTAKEQMTRGERAKIEYDLKKESKEIDREREKILREKAKNIQEKSRDAEEELHKSEKKSIKWLRRHPGLSLTRQMI